MPGTDDWRLQGQDAWLAERHLTWRRWTAPQPDWDHDHCAFCWAKFGPPEHVTEHEVDGITGLSYLAMGQPERAAADFRRIAENPDPVYRRNVGYYAVRLANASLQNRDVTGASQIATQALPLVVELDSRRTTNLLADLHDNLTNYRTSVPAAHDFTDLYRETFKP